MTLGHWRPLPFPLPGILFSLVTEFSSWHFVAVRWTHCSGSLELWMIKTLVGLAVFPLFSCILGVTLYSAARHGY